MNRPKRRHHGLALMMVLAIVGLASLIGMAMLASSSLQAQIASSTANAAAAEYMAESGMQVGTYYLQRGLTGMPASWSAQSGYAIYATGVTIPGVSGSFDVDAIATGNADEYQLHAVGHGGSSSSLSVARTSSAKVTVIRAKPNYAAGFGGNTTIGTNNTFSGTVVTPGTLSGLGAALVSNVRNAFTSTELSVPAAAAGNINYYGGTATVGTYTLPDGSVNIPQLVPSASLASPAVLVPNATNRGNVFYSMSDLTLAGGGTYNATFIVHGRLIIGASSTTITINRKAGLPAVVLDSPLYVNAKNTTVNINGVAWLGGGTTWGSAFTTSGTRVNINGSLLMPGGQTLATAVGTVTVNYQPSNVDVRNIFTGSQTGVGVKLGAWNP